MVSVYTSPRSLNRLLAPLFELAEDSDWVVGAMAGTFASGGTRYGLPRFFFSGPKAAHDRIRIGIFAGVHGDEPAGCEAAVQLLEELVQNPERARGYDLVVYPVCNPTGYQDNTRETRAGKDLNREFWKDSAEPEVRILEAELTAHRFDGIVTLHADDTCNGLYGYTHGRVLNESLLKPALAAAEAVLPRDGRDRIDGFAACDGLICDCFKGVLAAPTGQRPQPFDVIFETPAYAPFEAQVTATVLAIWAILDEYRGFIAYGQNL